MESVPKLVNDYMNKKLMVDEFVTHTLPFAQINEAFDLMHAGKRYISYNMPVFIWHYLSYYINAIRGTNWCLNANFLCVSSTVSEPSCSFEPRVQTCVLTALSCHETNILIINTLVSVVTVLTLVLEVVLIIVICV